jgi:uncharacterized protein (TIGR01732 family)
MYRDPDTHTYENNAPYGSNVPYMENIPHVHHGHYGGYSMPVYGYGHFVDGCGYGGYDGYGCHGYSSFFALIVVLFILLIIIGTTCGFGKHSEFAC